MHFASNDMKPYLLQQTLHTSWMYFEEYTKDKVMSTPQLARTPLPPRLWGQVLSCRFRWKLSHVTNMDYPGITSTWSLIFAFSTHLGNPQVKLHFFPTPLGVIMIREQFLCVIVVNWAVLASFILLVTMQALSQVQIDVDCTMQCT